MFHLGEKAICSIATAAFMSGFFRAAWAGVIFNFMMLNGPAWLRGLLFGGGPIWAIIAGILTYGSVFALSLPGVDEKAVEAARKESSSSSNSD